MSDAVGIHTHPSRKKGQRPPDPERMATAARFAVGLATAAPPYPTTWPLPSVKSWPMDGNDEWGDCVVAMIDHLLQAQAAALGIPRTNWTRDQILAYYRTQNPAFDPNGSSSTNGPGSDADGGMSEQKFLEHLVATGVIVAFGRVDHTSLVELAAATYLGIGIGTGVTVDQAQMSAQFDAGVWDYAKGSPVDGGHAIPLVGRPGRLVSITWAKAVELTDAFITHQMSEAWFVLTQPLIDHPTFRASYDLDTFAAAVAQVTGGKVVVPVTPVPAPSPTPVPGVATFQVSAAVAAHVASTATRAHMTGDAWLEKHPSRLLPHAGGWGMTVRGFDISHHNAEADLVKAKVGGFGFVYLKATQGVDFTDPTFVARKAAAKAAGLPAGAYLFFEPDADVAAQVAHFISVAGDDLALRVVLDHETASAHGPAAAAAAAAEAMRLLYRHYGYAPVLYTYRSFITDGSCTGLGVYPLWIADYSGHAAPIIPPGPWTTWACWQTGQGAVPGVTGGDGPGTDLNVARSLTPILKPAKPAPAPNPSPLLKKGSLGTKVADVQRALDKLGNQTAKKDGAGRFGTETDRILRKFQDNRAGAPWRLKVTGTTDPQTWAALRDAAHPTKG